MEPRLYWNECGMQLQTTVSIDEHAISWVVNASSSIHRVQKASACNKCKEDRVSWVKLATHYTAHGRQHGLCSRVCGQPAVNTAREHGQYVPSLR